MAQHYHSIDTFNGVQHTHETIDDLTLYLKATGEYGVKTRKCYDPKCLEEYRAAIAEGVCDDDEEWGPDSAQELLERGPRNHPRPCCPRGRGHQHQEGRGEMATYTFAESEAPTSKHVEGILQFLKVMIENETAYLAQHPRLTQREQAYARGKIHAWKDAIDVIKDSGSV